MNFAWIRLIVLVILVINQGLSALGYNPLPFSEEEIYNGVSLVVTTVIATYAWWKNNNVTDEAKDAQRYLDRFKEAKKK